MKYGLVMEGGAMRGMYTCGILDVLMEQNFYPFDGAVGVSAGATFGCNYASKQPGRAIRYNLKYAKDLRYCSAASLLLTGDLYGADFDYRRLPYQLDPFDTFTFRTNPMEFWVVATDTETGEPVYRELTTMGDDDLTWMRASASMPLASRMVEIDGRTYLDGGCSDAIPLKWFESRGYGKNVVILTQPKGYRKAPQKGLPAMRVLLEGAPGIVADMGGTTTDTGVVRHHSLTLSPVGAKVGQWQTQVDSAKLATFGLGGDTEIYPDVSAGAPVLTTHRVPPACRGGEKEDLTPTDLLCAEGSLTRWDTAASQYALAFQSRRAGLDQADYLSQAKALVVDRIVSKVFNEAAYSEGADAELPVIAIGAPAKTWYTLVKNEADVHRDILVPEHFEVANAVGAATAAIEERVDALVRPDEATEGYVAHVGGQSVFFEDKDKAVAYAKAEAGKIAQKQAESQGPETIHTDVTDKDIQQKIGWRWRYVETRVQAVARSGHLTLVPEEEKPAFEKNFD